MLLLRHAQSTWNEVFSTTRVDAAMPDPPLTEAGRAACEAIVPDLAAQGLSHVIASPYRRTLQTASIIAAGLGLNLAVEPLVRERCAFSCDQGTPASLLAGEWPALDFSGLDERWWGRLIESVASLETRAARFRAKAAGLPDRDSALVVTHWGFIRCVTGREVGNLAAVRLDLGSST